MRENADLFACVWTGDDAGAANRSWEPPPGKALSLMIDYPRSYSPERAVSSYRLTGTRTWEQQRSPPPPPSSTSVTASPTATLSPTPLIRSPPPRLPLAHDTAYRRFPARALSRKGGAAVLYSLEQQRQRPRVGPPPSRVPHALAGFVLQRSVWRDDGPPHPAHA